MRLHFADGTIFASGETPYEYRPATGSESSNRNVLTVEVESFTVSTFVDTGGVYFFCAPPLAQRLQLDPRQAIQDGVRLQWRGTWFTGSLHILPVTLEAVEGDSLTIDTTAFVPQRTAARDWDDELPCVLGMHGCLEQPRFAIDPESATFYFGSLSEQP